MCDPFRMKKPQHIFLLGAGLDTGNLGVGALTVGAIKCLKTQFPDAEISMLNYGKSESAQSVRLEGRQVSIPVVNMRFSWRVYLSNNIIVLLGLALLLKCSPRKLRAGLINKNRCLRELNEADFVASIAGGDSFADIYGLERLLYVSLPQILALLLGKKLILPAADDRALPAEILEGRREVHLEKGRTRISARFQKYCRVSEPSGEREGRQGADVLL